MKTKPTNWYAERHNLFGGTAPFADNAASFMKALVQLITSRKLPKLEYKDASWRSWKLGDPIHVSGKWANGKITAGQLPGAPVVISALPAEIAEARINDDLAVYVEVLEPSNETRHRVRVIDEDGGGILIATSPVAWEESIAKDESLPSTPTPAVAQAKIALSEAATRSYEQTRGTDVALFAEVQITKDGSLEDGILTWYCYAIADRIPIWGTVAPSRIPEKIDWRRLGLNFRVEAGDLVLRDSYNGPVYKDLEVELAEFEKALVAIKALGPERPEDRRKLKIMEELSRWIKVARPMQDALRDHDSMPPLEALNKWNHDVAEYLRNVVGLRYETRFTEPQKFTDDELGPLGRHHANMLRVGLERRIKQLYEIIDEHKIG